jgi:tRNA pseudouridine synthase 10
MGKKLRECLKINFENDVNSCFVCLGLSKEINNFANIILENLSKYEFKTFLIGVKVDEDILEREEEVLTFSDSEYGESIKNELKREIGKLIEKKIKQNVDFENPTLIAVVDTLFDIVYLQIKSLYIYGRYKKYRRGLPQTKWFCRICRGKGCRKCNYSGKLYKTSVEELISKKILEKTKGNSESFHGCGREDIDVCMLGNGRPFVIEIKNPMIRNIDLSLLEEDINIFAKGLIEVNNLRFSNKNEINRIKKSRFRKTYHILINGEKVINKEKLKKVAHSLQGKLIYQFTPKRVARRRANMVRERKIYNCKIVSVEDKIASLTIEAESGTYIKELISGDEGRTKPNISEMIGVPCIVKELDVIEIKGE